MPPPDQATPYSRRRASRERRIRQIGIGGEIKPGRPLLDAAEDQLLDGVEAWRAEFKGVLDRIGDQVLIERLHKPQDLDELALAAGALLTSRRRRNLRNCSGDAQCCKGRAWSSAPGFCSSQRQIMQGIADEAAALVRSLVAGDLLAGANDDHLVYEALYDHVAKAVGRGNRGVARAVANERQ
jgi:hypothetical protein